MAGKTRVSDLICKFFEEKDITNVFLLSGGMMMHLLDSISKSSKIKYLCNHHEQASAIAAEGYARIKNDVGLCYATSGPGATNTITGIAGAWLDSAPVIYITGQSRTTLTARGAGIQELRMLGNFEVNIVDIVKPITKFSVFVDKAEDILFYLQQAYYLALDGRPGSVLLDIPLDIQGSLVDLDNLRQFSIPNTKPLDLKTDFDALRNLLSKSRKPLIIGGHGIRVAKEVERFRKIIKGLQIPVVTTQMANDLMPYKNEFYIGKVGLRGDRAGNYAVQNADLIITIGTSLHITTTGYEIEHFAPNATKVVIDLDAAVLKKNEAVSNIQIQSDVTTLFDYLSSLEIPFYEHDWVNKLRKWKETMPIIKEPHVFKNDEINTYFLIDALSEQMKDDDILVTDAGSLYYIIGQAFKVKQNQRVLVSGALGAMGYALPASVGASCAAPDKTVVCITGDGSMQTNVQELQTISTYKLNCKIIVINNKGYASIRNSQAAFLNGHIAASSEDTGVCFPHWETLAKAYAIPYLTTDRYSNLNVFLKEVLQTEGPVFAEIVIPEDVIMIPAVTSVKLENGSFQSNKLHEMTPALSEEEITLLGLS